MRVLGAALKVDAALHLGPGGHAVVALQLEPARLVLHTEVRDLAEYPRRVHRLVAGGAHEQVHLQRLHRAGAQRLDGDPRARPVRLGRPRTAQVQEPQPRATAHFVGVPALIQVADQVVVDHRVVGVPVVVPDRVLGLVRGEVEVVHRTRVEDLVGQRRGVGDAVAQRGQDRVDVGVGEVVVEVADHLRRALSGAHDRDAAQALGFHGLEPGQELGAVQHRGAAFEAVRHLRHQAGRDHDVARVNGPAATGGLPDLQLQPVHGAVLRTDRSHRDDLGAVGNVLGEPGLDPFEIVVELAAAREEFRAVRICGQPALSVQIRHEAVGRRRVPERHQVLEERDLHFRVGQQHAPVPAEHRLLLEEESVHGGISGLRPDLVERCRE